MPINTMNKSLRLNNVSINENVSKWIEQDIIVPDTKPDAVKLINVTVSPYVNNVEVMQDKIKVSGIINYFIIYKVEDNTFSNRGLFTTHPYSEVLDVNGAMPDMSAVIKPICKNVIYSLPNERKISVKSEIVFKTKLKQICDINLINRFDCENEIECKMCKKDFCNIVQDKKSIIASKEEFMLPKEAEDFYELLNVETKIINKEYKESYNKIMLKGDIDIKIIYLSEDQNETVKKVKYTLPFSAMVELENINENSKFNISYNMQDFELKLNSDITTSKTMNADYQIEVDIVMYEDEEVEYIEDFYSQNNELKYNVNNINAVTKTRDFNKNISTRENISNIISDEMKLLDYRLDTSYIVPSVSGKNVNLEGQAKVSLLLQNTNTLELESKSIEIIVNENFEVENVVDSANIYVDIIDDNISITQNGTDLDVRIELVVNTSIEDVNTFNIIENIEDGTLDISNLDSINIYVVKNGDTLWNIAKKYKTSVDKIVMTNDIQDPNTISVGQKILVIR